MPVESGKPVRLSIPQVISSKSPALARVIPRPLVRYLERIIHVGEINGVLEEMQSLDGVDFVNAVLGELEVSTCVVHPERLALPKSAVVVANHPLGGLDGLALISAVANARGPVTVALNDILLNVPNLASIGVPVNKHGSNRDHRAAFEAAFAGERTVVHFPAGLCSRKKGSSIRDVVWQKSVIVRARRYNREVIPVHIDGGNSSFFYNLARLRRWSHIPFNIEMLYLADEMFKQRGAVLEMIVGSPIAPQTFDRSASDWEWAQRLKHHVYLLATKPDLLFRWQSGANTTSAA